MYARFFTKFLKRRGLLGFSEPFSRLFTQGMIYKNGVKMSKSKGNVVSPDPIIEFFGADTMRLYILFAGPPERDTEWRDDSVEGCHRFLSRIYRMWESNTGVLSKPAATRDRVRGPGRATRGSFSARRTGPSRRCEKISRTISTSTRRSAP